MTNIVPPLSFPTIADELLQWACETTGIPWVWSAQDAPQPAYPFGLLSVMAGPSKRGTDERRWDGDENLCHFGIRVFTVQFDCLVDKDDGGTMLDDYNARGILSILQSSLLFQATKTRFRRANVSVQDDAQTIQNLDEQVADRWISRASMDLVFNTTTALVETVGFFDRIEVSSDIDKVDGTPAPVQIENEILG